MKVLLQRVLLILVVTIVLTVTALFIWERYPNALDHWSITVLVLANNAGMAISRLRGGEGTKKL